VKFEVARFDISGQLPGRLEPWSERRVGFTFFIYMPVTFFLATFDAVAPSYLILNLL